MAVRGADTTATAGRTVAFGTVQERSLVPAPHPDRFGNEWSHRERSLVLPHHPDRFGNEWSHRERSLALHRGPGCYDNDQYGTIVYDLQKRPESNIGYPARTAQRFLPLRETSPSPQKYQRDHTLSTVAPPGKTPFNSTAPRFKSKPGAADSPGPGAYDLDTVTNRKVSWPRCFGPPDWDRLPKLERKTLRVEQQCDRDLRKQRSRVAYLSLYY